MCLHIEEIKINYKYSGHIKFRAILGPAYQKIGNEKSGFLIIPMTITVAIMRTVTTIFYI
jgi:hypothetical protein